MKKSLVGLAVMGLFLSFWSGLAIGEIRYTLVDLQAKAGKINGAYSINNGGQIVGDAWHKTFFNAATLFDSTGNGNNITLGGYSFASSINDCGQIVGSSGTKATLFDASGSGNNLILGDEDTIAESINNHGQIVGRSDIPYSINYRATLFDSTGNGNNIDLGSLGGVRSWAYCINDHGQIVGVADNSSGSYRATLFDITGNGNNLALGPAYSTAYSINNKGQIVGTLNGHAALFDASGDGNNLDLGTLGGSQSKACCINHNGQIAGWATNNAGEYRATLFDASGNGDNVDLNTLIDPSLGWVLTQANSINDQGWIVGTGIDPNDPTYMKSFLLKPVPEPGSLLLLGSGVGVFFRRRRG